jgi:hypothetical protein
MFAVIVAASTPELPRSVDIAVTDYDDAAISPL